MLPLEVIKKYYPNATEEELKGIQTFVYQLCCGVMQYFYGDNWEGATGELHLKNEEG